MSLAMHRLKPLLENGISRYDFTDADFAMLCGLVRKHTGIALSEHKRDLVYGRLSKRLRALGLSRFCDYCDLLESNPAQELEQFTNAITTNLTAFFRENHHFEYLQKTLAPALLERYRRNKKLRIWSAGCSTGEEPYSLAMALRESIPDIDDRDIRILASDLDSNVVATGAEGIYPSQRIESLSHERKKRWFELGKGSNVGKVRVSQDLRKLVSFRQLNMLQDWPMSGKFDVVFCRNVVIYFDKATQKQLFERFANVMQPESTLCIGHSETLHNICDRFELAGKTIYRKLS